MVGIVFRDQVPIDSLRDLQHVAEVGKVPDQGEELPGHRDGWGIATFMTGSPRYVGKSERPVHIDPSFDAAIESVRSLEGPNVLIAHARRGSEGSRSLANTHPFIAEGIAFAHNGTVKKFDPSTKRKAKGETDSERLFMALLDRFDEKRDLRSAMKSLLKEDIPGHEYTAVILQVSDGRSLIGYRGYYDEKNAWYYDLRLSVCKDVVTFFQETVLGYSGDVMQLRNGEMATVDTDFSITRDQVL
jgi:predicted glutamine amidotransferase